MQGQTRTYSDSIGKEEFNQIFMSFREDLVHIPKTTIKIRGGEGFLTELPNIFVSSVIFLCVCRLCDSPLLPNDSFGKQSALELITLS